MDLSRFLLKKFQGLRGLFKASHKELQAVSGLGPAKVATLKALAAVTVRYLAEESASLNLPSSIGALNSRIDRDAAGQWKTTQSFGRNDLLVLAKVADRAHSRIFELQRAEDESERAA